MERCLVIQNAGCVQVLAVLPKAPGDGFEKPDRPQRKDDPSKICQLQNAKPHRIPWKVRDTLPTCIILKLTKWESLHQASIDQHVHEGQRQSSGSMLVC